MEKKTDNINAAKKNQKQNHNQDNIINNISIEELQSNILKNEKEIHNIRLRKLAEIDNIKKNTNIKKEFIKKIEKEIFFKKILPIIDTFEEISLLITENNLQDKSEMIGLNLTFKSLLKIINESGVKTVGKKNEIVDENIHDIISSQISDKIKPNHVISVIQKGYTLNELLLRKAKIIISKK